MNNNSYVTIITIKHQHPNSDKSERPYQVMDDLTLQPLPTPTSY